MQKQFQSALTTKKREKSVTSSVRDDSARPKSQGAAVRAELDAVKKQNEQLKRQVDALQNMQAAQSFKEAPSVEKSVNQTVNASFDGQPPADL